MNAAEVEALIETTVSRVVDETPSLEPCRRALIERLTQALESDAKWVELYGLTGEVLAPVIADENDELEAGLQRATQVCRTSSVDRTIPYSHTSDSSRA